MNNRILELAKEATLFECSSNWYVGCEEELEAFYKAAYNDGVAAACDPVRDRMIGYAVDDYDLKMLEKDIKELEMK